MIEISRTKVKYYIVAIRMSKNQKTQVLEYHYKQGKKLIKSAGGIEALADRIKFKFGTLSILDLNKLLFSTTSGGPRSTNDLAIRKAARIHSKADQEPRMVYSNR